MADLRGFAVWPGDGDNIESDLDRLPIEKRKILPGGGDKSLLFGLGYAKLRRLNKTATRGFDFNNH